MIRAVIFDLDELIIDLEKIHKAAERQICLDFGYAFDDLSPDLRFNTSGLRENDILAKIKAELKIPATLPELIERKQALFTEMMGTDDLVPMPGVRDVVTLLHDQGYSLALTSSGARPRVEAVLRRLGFFEVFEIIICGEDVQRGKPDPEPYRLTVEHLNIVPGEGVVFEDADVGVASAKAAGLWCIGVPNPAAVTPQSLHQADLVLPDLTHFSLKLFSKFNR